MAKRLWPRWPVEWKCSCGCSLCLFWPTVIWSAGQGGEDHISHIRGVKGLWWFSLPVSWLRRWAISGPHQRSFLQSWRFPGCHSAIEYNENDPWGGALPEIHCHIHCFESGQLQVVLMTLEGKQFNLPCICRLFTVLNGDVEWHQGPQTFGVGVGGHWGHINKISWD